MRIRNERLIQLKRLIEKRKVMSFDEIMESSHWSEATVRRDVANLEGISSFTHNGRFITLPSIPHFNEMGIWFRRKTGFTKFNNSLELIVNIIDTSQNGITKEELDEVLKIDVYKQINTLLQRDQIYRVKTGRKYLYLPNSLAKNKKKRLRLLPTADIEECHLGRVKTTDLVALLKAVLIEKEVNIDVPSIRRISRKYSLKIPAKQVEQLLNKYDLFEKKTP